MDFSTGVVIAGGGAFLMTCMELLTASTHRLGLVPFVFNDGELSQISQAQEIPCNRKVCSVIDRAFVYAADGQPVIVDVRIDYSKRTRFTRGVVATNLKRFDLGTQLRFGGRALVRRVTG